MPAPAPCTSPAEHTRHGLAHYTRGDLQRAAAAFAQAAAASPDEPLCWSNLAMAQADLGDPAAAEAALRRSLALDAGQALWTGVVGRGRACIPGPAGQADLPPPARRPATAHPAF